MFYTNHRKVPFSKLCFENYILQMAAVISNRIPVGYRRSFGMISGMLPTCYGHDFVSDSPLRVIYGLRGATFENLIRKEPPEEKSHVLSIEGHAPSERPRECPGNVCRRTASEIRTVCSALLKSYDFHVALFSRFLRPVLQHKCPTSRRSRSNSVLPGH